ncbi:MAG: phage holin family protein [Leptothrix sp. (in: b-proteobacteria)]
MSLTGDFIDRASERLRRIADIGLALLHTRLQLLGVELQQELLRVYEALLRAVLALLLLTLGVFFAVALLVVLLWDGYRLQALGGAAMLLIGGGLWLLRDARRRLQVLPGGTFAASVGELRRDRAGLDGELP